MRPTPPVDHTCLIPSARNRISMDAALAHSDIILDVVPLPFRVNPPRRSLPSSGSSHNNNSIVFAPPSTHSTLSTFWGNFKPRPTTHKAPTHSRHCRVEAPSLWCCAPDLRE